MITDFEQLEIKPEIKKALQEMNFKSPTPIQAEVIPHMLKGSDCLAQAPTGTGKTCAFGIPIINNVDKNSKDVQALILCPTRELAMQIEAELKRVAQYVFGVKILAVFGGQPLQKQLAGLRRNPQIIIGTPGRLMDHLRRKTITLEKTMTLVLDEADEMLDMGFRDDIDTILSQVKNIHQTVMFSATMSKEILAISAHYQESPVSVQTKQNNNTIPDIQQYYVRTKDNKKLDALCSLWHSNDFRLGLIFCNTKRRVDELRKQLYERNMLVEALHGDMRQNNRDKVMKKFRKGEINLLIATDVVARGIDVNGVEVVFNYDAPNNEEFYIHRIGRTARAGESGVSYTLACDKDMPKIKIFEKITKSTIPELFIEGITSDKPLKAKKSATSERFFINVGKLDKLTEKDLLDFVCKKGGFGADKVSEIKMLDIFSFIELEGEFKDNLLDLNGLQINGRKISIEPAGKESSKPRSQSSGRGGKPYTKSTDTASYGARKVSGGKSSYGDKKREYSGERKSSNSGTYGRSDGARKSSTDGTFADKKDGSSYGDRKPSGSYGEKKSGSYGDRKPSGSYGDRKPSGSYGRADGARKSSTDGTYAGKREYQGAPRSANDGTYSEGGSPAERKVVGSYGDRKPSSYGDRKPSGSYGEKKSGSYGKSDGARKSSGASYGKTASGARKSGASYSGKPSSGARKPSGSYNKSK